MTDYESIQKDLDKRFHRAFGKLYISELKDQIAEKDEVITAQDHTIVEQQEKIDFLNRSHEALVNIINKREARIEQLEEVLKEIQDKSSLVYEQTRGRLFLINKIAAVALGADPKDFEPGGNEHRAALENK